MRTAGVITTSAATCPAGRAVELITIAGSSVARSRPRLAGPEAPAHRLALHGAGRDAGHLAVLRLPRPPGPLRVRPSPRPAVPATGGPRPALTAMVATYFSPTALPIQSLSVK
jgi:hypothetical protein